VGEDGEGRGEMGRGGGKAAWRAVGGLGVEGLDVSFKRGTRKECVVGWWVPFGGPLDGTKDRDSMVARGSRVGKGFLETRSARFRSGPGALC